MICELYCEKWFHIRCVNISKDDFGKIKSLGKKRRWFCDRCEITVNKGKSDKGVCCDCFSYINILIECIKDVTENQK